MSPRPRATSCAPSIAVKIASALRRVTPGTVPVRPCETRASPWRSSSLEMKRISSGQAAQLAGMDRTTFLMLLAESGLTMINGDSDMEEGCDSSGVR